MLEQDENNFDNFLNACPVLVFEQLKREKYRPIVFFTYKKISPRK